MNVFFHDDYKSALKWSLQRLKEEGRKVSLSRLAEASGVQKTYLSRVLNHDGHLNSDQLHQACKFLQFRTREYRYVNLLYEAERSGVPERKENLRKEAKRMQQKAQNTENYIAAESVETRATHLLQYHLDPFLQLIHLFLTIPRFAKNPRLIETLLALTQDELANHLNQLTRANLISWDGKNWKVLQETVHLSSNSEIYPFYRVLLRAKTLDKLQRGSSSKDYSFSVIYSADESTRVLVQQKFMKFLKEIEPLIRKSDAKEVYQINFDHLIWSER